MKFRSHLIRLSLVAGLAAAGFSSLRAAEDPRDEEIRLLRQQVNALDQKLRVLERKFEIREETEAVAPKPVKVAATDKGFSISSADNANSIKLRGLVQLDSRVFFADDGVANNTSFVLRRARIISEGTFAKNFSFQLVPEFGGGSVSLLDANLGVTVDKSLQFRFGKFKSLVGLELLQSDSWTFFDERSLVTNLVPNRDIGVLATGDLFNDTVNYNVGILGGVPDGGSSTNSDFDNEKDFVGRVYVTPFKKAKDSPLAGLSVGVGASIGREKTASGRTSGYRTDGQQTFFAYNAAVISDGQSWRVSPQFDYRLGSFGLLGEYAISTVNVRPSATGAKTQLQNKGWQLAAGYVLTGEDSSFNGVVPRANFDFGAGTWGAFEIAARYANLKVDDAAFPLFASASTNADEASSIGLGLNWYLSKVVRFTFDYYQTAFDFAPGAPAISATPLLRQDEKVLITRFQVSF